MTELALVKRRRMQNLEQVKYILSKLLKAVLRLNLFEVKRLFHPKDIWKNKLQAIQV